MGGIAGTGLASNPIIDTTSTVCDAKSQSSSDETVFDLFAKTQGQSTTPGWDNQNVVNPQTKTPLSEIQLEKLAEFYENLKINTSQVKEIIHEHGNTYEQWQKADSEWLNKPLFGNNIGTNRDFVHRLTGPNLDDAPSPLGTAAQAAVLSVGGNSDMANAARVWGDAATNLAGACSGAISDPYEPPVESSSSISSK